ncbi:unnamed protein product [Cunninghamella blakesleeana]
MAMPFNNNNNNNAVPIPIHIKVKVIEWLVTVEATHNDKKVQVYEYIVGDSSGCIMLKTIDKDLVVGKWITLNNAYTQLINGSLRLVISHEKDIVIHEESDDDKKVDTSNNVSFTNYVIKY